MIPKYSSPKYQKALPPGVRTRGQLATSAPRPTGFINVVQQVPVIQSIPVTAPIGSTVNGVPVVAGPIGSVAQPGGGLQQPGSFLSGQPLLGGQQGLAGQPAFGGQLGGLSGQPGFGGQLGGQPGFGGQLGGQPGLAGGRSFLPQTGGPVLSDLELATLPRDQALRQLLGPGSSAQLADKLRALPLVNAAAAARIRQASDAIVANAARATNAELDAANQAADVQVNTLAEAVADLRDQHRRDFVGRLIRQNDIVELSQQEERERLADQIDQLMAKHELVNQLATQSIASQTQSKTQAAIVAATQRQQRIDQLNRELNLLQANSDRPRDIDLISKSS